MIADANGSPRIGGAVCEELRLSCQSACLKLLTSKLLLLAGHSRGGSNLQGNAYSLLEPERLLELTEAAQGKAAFETQMILNYRNAIELLAQSPTHGDIGINQSGTAVRYYNPA